MIKNKNKTTNSKILAIGLFIYLLLLPLDFISIANSSVTKYLVIIPFLFSLPALLTGKFKFNNLYFVLILYIINILISILYSVNSTLSFDRLVSVSTYFIIIIYFSSFKYTREDFTIIEKGLVYSGIVVLLLFLISNPFDQGFRKTLVIFGNEQDPNYLVGFLIYPFLYSFYNFVERKKIKSLIFITLYLIAVLLTGSRGGLVAIIFSALYLVIVRRKIKIKSMLSFTVAAIAVIILLNYVVPSDILNRFTLDYTVDDSGAGRFLIWKETINVFMSSNTSRKMFGYGMGTVTVVGSHSSVSHNIWLDALIESGIIGVVILLIMYYNFFKKSLKTKELLVVGSLIGYIVMGLSLSLNFYKPIWNLFMIIIILNNNSNFKKNYLGGAYENFEKNI